MDAERTLAAGRVIAAVGGAYSRELGIDLSRPGSAGIFPWFLAAKLMGARIGTTIALRTYREFERRGVLSPERIRRTGWDGLVAILDAGGYARYDFSTADKLLAIAADLVREYGGDLDALHERAEGPADLEKRLKALGKGIGDVTVGIFLRELRTVWAKARPELSPFVLLAARELGLLRQGEDPLKALSSRFERENAGGRDFRDYEAALLRLGKDYCRKSRCDACPLGRDCPRAAPARP